MHVNVAIIGLDRVGTSFGLALKRYEGRSGASHDFTIIGSDLSGEAMKAAKKLNAIDNFHRQLLKAVDNADLILLNTPYALVEDHYERMGPALKPGAVVLDLTPLKDRSNHLAAQHFRKANSEGQVAYALGITPIVRATGLYEADHSAECAQADLFDEMEVFIAPDAGCPSEVIALAEDVISLVGAQPRFIDPHEHDGLIAATEGLPALLGAAMFYMLQGSDGWRELRRMVNPNLAITFQNLRYDKPEDLLELSVENRDNLLRHLDAYINTLGEVREALASDEGPEAMEALLSVVYEQFNHWDIKRHSGKWDEKPQVETRPGPLGPMGNVFGFGGRRQRDNED